MNGSSDLLCNGTDGGGGGALREERGPQTWFQLACYTVLIKTKLENKKCVCRLLSAWNEVDTQLYPQM
jgi:hypothetical protein